MKDPLPLDALGDIPDPAAGIAARPAPPPPAPPADPSPTRTGRRLRLRLAAALAVVWIAIVVHRVGLRGDAGSPLVIGELVLLGILVAVGIAAAIRPGARGLPPGVRAVQVGLGVLPAVYALVSFLVAPSHGGAPAVPLTWSTASPCLGTAGATALGPLVLAGLLLQRSFPSAPALRGAAVGAACGVGGVIGIHLHCAVDAPSHLLVAHGAIIVAGALAGAVLGAVRGRM